MEYLRSCFVALLPARAERARQYPDLEAYGEGAGAESVVLVTDAADVRVQVRPLLRASDIGDAVNAV
jgi:hypothetical protein